MSIVKSLSVGNGDMYYIVHNSDNFTIIDCCLTDENKEEILSELKDVSKSKQISRFISTHPDHDHILGIKYLDENLKIVNFYCVKNNAVKADITESFDYYMKLRDDVKIAYYISKDCTRKWMNLSDEARQAAGINVLWPKLDNEHFSEELLNAALGVSFNNICPVIRYSLQNGASFMWIGDLETDFMESILPDINLQKTTIVFAPHHGRETGRIPGCWLEILDPQIIVIGQAPSRHLHYYTGYKTITQNRSGDITFEAVGNKVHMYVSNLNYGHRFDDFHNEYKYSYPNYIGSITVETEPTI